MEFKSYVTDYEQGKFWEEQAETAEGFDCMKAVCVYPSIKDQTIKGFGGAFTEAVGSTLLKMSEQNQEEIIQAYFGEDGLRYNLGRTHINSCDFALGNYAYMEDPEDWEMKSFSIEHDYLYLIPMILRAQKARGEQLCMLASPWSPPAFMKTNGEMNHGGKLKEEYAHMWAQYVARYIKEYEKAGVQIHMITVQNEPMATQTWDSCVYEVEEERDYVKNHLGPVLEEEGLGHIKIVIWDHNKEMLYDRATGVLTDAEAEKYVDGVGFHWYTGDHFEQVQLVHKLYPQKELIFTEGCVEYSRFADSSDVGKAEMYAHDMIGNLNAGTNGYLDWNLVLDEKGGPNHVGNFCAAPIMCDTINDVVEKRASYYYIGQLSRYTMPGAVRIFTSKYTDKLDVTAFENPDGGRVVVLLNKQDADVPVSLCEGTEARNFVVKAHTMMTVCYQ